MGVEIDIFDSETAALTVADRVPAMMAYWDTDLVCRFANAGYLDWFGYTREQMVNKLTLKDLLGPIFELNLPYINNVLEGQAQSFERDITLAPGDTRHTLANYIPHVVAGVVRGFFVHVADITHTKLLEKELLRTKVLETKNKELEHFTHIASHDLQEPLRTVLSYIKVLEMEYGSILDERASLYLNGMENSVKRMSEMVEALSKLSRLGLLGEATPVNCNTIVTEVKEDLASLMRSTGATINSEDLPVIISYPVQLRLLFQNLLNNALKFSKTEIAPQIFINSRETNDAWQFSIADNGIGISESHFETIFQIFKKLNSKEDYKGNGLGLANCKRIVDLLGGDIWLTSTLGVGSTFYFTIPKIAK